MLGVLTVETLGLTGSTEKQTAFSQKHVQIVGFKKGIHHCWPQIGGRHSLPSLSAVFQAPSSESLLPQLSPVFSQPILIQPRK